MKKSQIAMLALAGLIIIVILIVMGLGRFAIGKSLDNPSTESPTEWAPSGDEVSKKMNLSGFDTVVVEAVWKVRINRSDEFSTEIYYPSDMEDRLDVRVRGNQLVLGIKGNQSYSDTDLTTVINMPSLSELRIDGAADIYFSGFDEDELSISIDGAANIEGSDSKVEKLKVGLDGMGKVDLTAVPSVDARVDLNGAGDIRLLMNGGVLDGSLEGMGNIVYSGKVSEERIHIDGLGRVRAE